jgi:putative lipoic acid-binding regulatory protein
MNEPVNPANLPENPPEIPPEQSLIQYPCAFPIKVMGLHEPPFVETMVALAVHHDPGFDAKTLELRPSSSGKYLGLTITVNATSREHLDNIYRAFTGHPLVKYVL